MSYWLLRQLVRIYSKTVITLTVVQKFNYFMSTDDDKHGYGHVVDDPSQSKFPFIVGFWVWLCQCNNEKFVSLKIDICILIQKGGHATSHINMLILVSRKHVACFNWLRHTPRCHSCATLSWRLDYYDWLFLVGATFFSFSFPNSFFIIHYHGFIFIIPLVITKKKCLLQDKLYLFCGVFLTSALEIHLENKRLLFSLVSNFF